MKRHVAILVFDEVEVLDFAGPFEVFAVTDELRGYHTFNTYTVAELPGTVRARNGLKIMPAYTLETAPAPHLLVVPGGAGTRALLKKPSVLDWVRQRAAGAEHIVSVCTGSLVLGAAGLLDGLPATTHYENFAELRHIAPRAEVVQDRRFLDNGKVLTSAGIAAGIDVSLHLVAKLLGVETAQATARYMEYHWRNDAGQTR
ncbi:MAG: DJ-1/PfpI family protein [Opitutae bacterium]|nr:DJ-1/PfpI family protein [Opitutae bacterium]